MSQIVSNPYEQDPVATIAAEAATNPYLQPRNEAPPPDLDAAAPSLRNDEQQRVNRKALMFLGGIVLLLAMMAFVVFKSTGKPADAAKPAEEQVSIPTLSDTNTPPLPMAASGASAAPIDVQASQDAALPPLPPQPAYASTMPPPTPGMDAPVQQGRVPTLLERRMGMQADPAASGGGSPQNAYAQAVAMTQAAMAGQAGAAKPDDMAGSGNSVVKATSARALRNPDALLVRGTLLRCVLETRIISEAEGFTSCILTEPVYSINGRSLLLPRGSKIYGAYKARPKGDRIEVVWDRVTTPTGIDVNMMSPGVDALGSAGYRGALDSHWGTRITSAVMISLLSDAFKYAAAQNGPTTAEVSQGVVIESPYESNTARTLDRLAHQAADEAMSRAPTVTINQGSLVSVYIARDVDFSEVLGR